jgi:DNA-binding response OmpR family regulator
MKGTLPILVIEDDPKEQEKIQQSFIFNQIRNPVYCAGDRQTAFRYLSSIFYNPLKRQNPLPGAIILSHSPVLTGDTSVELLRELKADKIYNQIPVIVFSDSPDVADMERFYGMGCHGYFKKPDTQEGYHKMVELIYNFWLHLSVPYYSAKAN